MYYIEDIERNTESVPSENSQQQSGPGNRSRVDPEITRPIGELVDFNMFIFSQIIPFVITKQVINVIV